ncbi:MAG: hypothetical protein PVI21_01055 [Candidatus Woesebacteria bacterium]
MFIVPSMKGLKMRRWLTWIGAAIAVILVVALIGVGIWYSEKQRQDQLADFKADVIASGFTLAPVKDNPSIEDETKTKGTGAKAKTKTKTTFEAIVLVDGCAVELERNMDEDRNIGKRGGRIIELYELDEGVDARGDEIEIDDAPIAPTPSQVSQYLGSDRRFAFCLRV